MNELLKARHEGGGAFFPGGDPYEECPYLRGAIDLKKGSHWIRGWRWAEKIEFRKRRRTAKRPGLHTRLINVPQIPWQLRRRAELLQLRAWHRSLAQGTEPVSCREYEPWRAARRFHDWFGWGDVLRRCDFCSHVPFLKSDRWDLEQTRKFGQTAFVFCHMCGTSGPVISSFYRAIEGDVIKQWNKKGAENKSSYHIA